MSMASKNLAAVNDEIRLNASEGLSGSIAFHLVTVSGTWTVIFEAKALGAPDAAFVPIQAALLSSGVLATGASADGIYRIDSSPQLMVRCRQTVAGPGTLTVWPMASLG